MLKKKGPTVTNMFVNNVLTNRHMTELNPIYVGEEDCTSGYSFGPKIRKYTLIHYVVKGSGRVIKSTGEYFVRAGQAFIILPDEVVTYVADKNTPWHYQWVAFDGTLSSRFAELPVVVSFPALLMEEMLKASKKDMPEYRVVSLLFDMYVKLFETQKASHHYVRRVQNYIHSLYMNPISVDGIAAELNLDRRYLSRIFKKKTGQTIQEYIISTRMDEAKNYLSHGYSVKEVAHFCGYDDVLNFSKMFKKRFGISPSKWKKTIKAVD